MYKKNIFFLKEKTNMQPSGDPRNSERNLGDQNSAKVRFYLIFRVFYGY